MWASETVGLRSVHAGKRNTSWSFGWTNIHTTFVQKTWLPAYFGRIHSLLFFPSSNYIPFSCTDTDTVDCVCGRCVCARIHFILIRFRLYWCDLFMGLCLRLTCMPCDRFSISWKHESNEYGNDIFSFIKFLLCVFWSASFDPYDFNGEWMLNRLAKSKKWQFFCFTLKMFSMWYDFEREKWFSFFSSVWQLISMRKTMMLNRVVHHMSEDCVFFFSHCYGCRYYIVCASNWTPY